MNKRLFILVSIFVALILCEEDGRNVRSHNHGRLLYDMCEQCDLEESQQPIEGNGPQIEDFWENSRVVPVKDEFVYPYNVPQKEVYENPRVEKIQEVEEEACPTYNVPQREEVCDERPKVGKNKQVKEKTVPIHNVPQKEDVYESPRVEKIKQVKEKAVPTCEVPHIENVFFTSRDEQLVKEESVLICTPNSYFRKIIATGPYLLNTTCWGIEQQKKGVTTCKGITRHDNRNVNLKKDKITITTTSTDGNIIKHIRQPVTDCECQGDLLLALGIFILEEPTVGCCDRNTPSDVLTAVAYEIEIIGKCASKCSLHKSTIEYERDVGY